MTNDEVKAYAYDHAKEILTPDGHGGFICPLCQSGTGKNKTGMREHTGNKGHYKCFACDFYGDILDIIGAEYNVHTYIEKIEAARKEFGLPDFSFTGEKVVIPKREEHQQTAEEMAAAEEARKKRAYSINNFLGMANKRLKKCDYHNKRGISDATAERFYLGYADVGSYGNALVIPTGRYGKIEERGYAVRYTTAPQVRFYKPAGVPTLLFNIDALWNTFDKPVFIVEGEIDALSIEEVGGAAVGLGGISNIKKLVEALQKEKPSTLLIVSMDNDEKGKEASERLVEELKKLEVPFIIHNPCSKHKDCNDALLADRVLFADEILAFKGCTTRIDAEQARKRAAYLRTSALFDIRGFLDDIKESVNTPPIKTGFDKLDNRLEGGLYEGLYVIGAVSSLGKTTYCLQMADQIAKNKQDVMIFSLEMAKTELMAKSISRQTCQYCLTNKHDIDNAKTMRGITDGRRYLRYSKDEVNIIKQSVDAYRDIAEHIFIIEGRGDVTAQTIYDTVADHIKITGRKPVVIVDYMQILTPMNERTSDKQNTDKAVLELKRLSRDFKIPVVAVSSFNRDNYDKEVTMSAFKESGGIEYGCDVLIGFQLNGAGSKDFRSSEVKDRNPRPVDLRILKNRHGGLGQPISYNFYTKYNHFEEIK